MTWSLAGIYRHPVKSLGEEALDAIDLIPGKGLPFDRAWAIAHGGSEWNANAPGWLHCRNFVTQRHVAAMSQTQASYDEKAGVLSLMHPDRPDLAIEPGSEAGAKALTEWLAPMAEDRQKGPYVLAVAPDVAFTDGDEWHVSVASVASRRALEERLGMALPTIRFRMNLWLEGPPAWEELGHVGKEIEIGPVVLKIIDRCTRCNSTNANPATGRFDTQIPRVLQDAYGHMDFGVHTQVIKGGTIRQGDAARLI